MDEWELQKEACQAEVKCASAVWSEAGARGISKGLTADSCFLAMSYRVLHVHCHEKEFEDTQLLGR